MPPPRKCQFHQHFYKQLFCTKVFQAAFLYLGLRFVFFLQKEIGAKAARKMLMKLTAAGGRRCEPEKLEVSLFNKEEENPLQSV